MQHCHTEHTLLQIASGKISRQIDTFTHVDLLNGKKCRSGVDSTLFLFTSFDSLAIALYLHDKIYVYVYVHW